MAERTYRQMLDEAYRRRCFLRGEGIENGDFVVSQKELLVLRDQPPFHLEEMNDRRTRLCGLRIAVLLEES
jgi:hypothetical protein